MEDIQPQPAAEQVNAPPRRKVKKRLVAGLLALLLVAALGYHLWNRGRVSTDDAFVDGHVYTITPRVAGYLVQVAVDDNQEVKKGQLLAVLDPSEYEVAQAQARANLAEAQATLTSLELGVPLELNQTDQRVRGAKAELAALRKNLAAAQQEEEAASQDFKRAQAALQQADLDHRRALSLFKSGTVSQSSLDEAQTRRATSQAAAGAAQARRDGAAQKRASLAAELDRLRANIELAATGQDQATIKSRQVEAQQARVELAKDRLKQAELDLGYTRILAPAEGRITRKKIEPGQMVARGQPLMALVPLHPRELWITANFKETQLSQVRPGQPVEVEVDAYPGVSFQGKVESIMAGTGAAFSLFPPENASGNYVKVVQRIPVKIVLDDQGQRPGAVLRLGMSVVPTIHTGR